MIFSFEGSAAYRTRARKRGTSGGFYMIMALFSLDAFKSMMSTYLVSLLSF